jgi:hypothetical protein
MPDHASYARSPNFSVSGRGASKLRRAATLLSLVLLLLVFNPKIAHPASPALQVPSANHLKPIQVRAYVLAQAKLAGVNPVKVDWIVGHESHYGQRMRGDDGQSRGFWMISGVYHPEVSDACADDLPCSTEWSLNRILAGHINEWSAFRFCRRLWPQSCPF